MDTLFLSLTRNSQKTKNFLSITLKELRFSYLKSYILKTFYSHDIYLVSPNCSPQCSSPFFLLLSPEPPEPAPTCSRSQAQPTTYTIPIACPTVFGASEHALDRCTTLDRKRTSHTSMFASSLTRSFSFSNSEMGTTFNSSR